MRLPRHNSRLGGKPDYGAVEPQLRAYLADWVGHTADDGKKAISNLPAETKTKNRETNL